MRRRRPSWGAGYCPRRFESFPSALVNAALPLFTEMPRAKVFSETQKLQRPKRSAGSDSAKRGHFCCRVFE